MRTCSLLLGLAILGGICAALMSRAHRHCAAVTCAPPPKPPERFIKVNGEWVDRTTVGHLTPGVAPVEAPPSPVVPQKKATGGKELVPGTVQRKDGQDIVWTITSAPHTSDEQAREDALTQAQAEIVAHFRKQGTPLEWLPPTKYVLTLMKDKPLEVKEPLDDVGEMHWAVMEVRFTPANWSDVARYDREYRAQGRMLWLGKLLAGLVAVLAATAGYFRLDEMTKGYYTTYLRATVGFVGASALLLMLA